MKAFIVLALFAVAQAGPALVSTYNAALPAAYSPLAYGAAPLGYSAGLAPAVTYAAPAAAAVAPGGFGYQSVTTHAVAAAPVATYAAAPVAYSAPIAAPVAYSAPIAAPVAYSAPVAAPVTVQATTATQYHAQDVLGQASFGYSHPGQAHHAVRDAAGNVRGSYAYINPDGNQIQVNYVADQGGFRAESNALPQAPVHIVPGTVAAAPVAVPAAFPISVGSVPADTPEVVEARIAHAHAHAQARARNLVFRKKRAIVAPAVAYAASGVFPAATTALTYSSVHHPVHSYSTTIQHPSAFATYSAVHHPTAYAAYAAPAAFAAPAAYAAPALVAPATYTQIHNNPGHAVSYRVY